MKVKLFYWEENKDYSLTDNVSENSERLLPRVRGKFSIIYYFSEERPFSQAHILTRPGCYFNKKVVNNQEEQIHH